MNKCFLCGKKIDGMPFHCWRCGEKFCPDHRLPEDHLCEEVYHLLKNKKPAPKPILVPTPTPPLIPVHIKKQPEKQELPKQVPKSKEHHIENLNDDIPRQKLNQILKEYDIGILDDSKRLRSILNDLCMGKYSREINALIGSLDEQVPQYILKSKTLLPYTVLSGQLKKKLLENTYLSENLVDWAIESWASALGVSDINKKG